MVLKSIDFGVPQNRQRIYIVLWRDESVGGSPTAHREAETAKAHRG